MKRILRRLLTPPLMLLAALFLFFEEWLWERLKAVMAALGQLPVVKQMEVRIAGLSPGPALLVFLTPTLLLLPVKLGALALIAKGHALQGVLLILGAKMLGMAVFSRIFVLCRPALLTVPRFRRLHDWVLNWSQRLHAWMDSLPAWRAAKRKVAGLRESLAGTIRSWMRPD